MAKIKRPRSTKFQYEMPKDKVLHKGLQGNVLFISPHPDDAAISAGGLLSRIGKKTHTTILNCYSGHRGVSANKSKKDKISLRASESEDEATLLGVHSEFLDLEAYEQNYQANKKDQDRMLNALRLEKAKHIFLPDFNDPHPAHQAIHQFVLELILKNPELAPQNLWFYESPWNLFTSGSMNTFVPLSKIELNRKLKGIRAHKSQVRRTAFDDSARALARLRAIISPEQELSGFGSRKQKRKYTYMECFKHYLRRK